MVHFLSVVFQVVRRNLLLFAFIVLVLASGKWIRNEWGHVQSRVNELPALRSADQDVIAHQEALARAMTRQVRGLSGATVQQLDAHIRVFDDQISVLQREQDAAPLSPGALKGADWMVEQLRQKAMRGVEIELRRQARAYLIAVRAHAVVMNDRQAALEKLEQLRLAHVRAYGDLQRTEQQLRQVGASAGLLAKIPFTPWQRQVEALEKRVEERKAANSTAHQQYRVQQAILDRLSPAAALPEFRVDQERLADAAALLRNRLRQAESLAAQSLTWQLYQALRPVLPAALLVLIAWWLVPAAIRTLFYFVLAPQAARRPPIVIQPPEGSAPAVPLSNRGAHRDSPVISAVSQRVMLAPGYEMLIRPDYCQSQPAGVKVTTKLLFNWQRWLTSIAAHLWMLKRFHTAGSTQAAEIVVSSVADALDEVALLEIAAGEALVLQPRGLVGMVYQTGQRPRIRSHWRLGTLHAWLTLQLRYLAFEGPVTLIVKGCRGVRLESAASGRTISQDATLGFSANALYATVRADPFIPYLRGRQALFHDQFNGQDAYYLYEEVPRNARPGGRQSNPLETLLDAGLKAFGI